MNVERLEYEINEINDHIQETHDKILNYLMCYSNITDDECSELQQDYIDSKHILTELETKLAMTNLIQGIIDDCS